MIDADRYPDIKITLDENISKGTDAPASTGFQVGLTFNGQTNTYICHYTSNACYQYRRCLTGKLQFKLSDFGIDPPKKFLGVVKVEDIVSINFKIVFTTNQF